MTETNRIEFKRELTDLDSVYQNREANNVNRFSLTIPNLSTNFRESQ